MPTNRTLLQTDHKIENCPFCGGPVNLYKSDVSEKIAVLICDDTSSCINSGLGMYLLVDKLDQAVLQFNARAHLIKPI